MDKTKKVLEDIKKDLSNRVSVIDLIINDNRIYSKEELKGMFGAYSDILSYIDGLLDGMDYNGLDISYGKTNKITPDVLEVLLDTGKEYKWVAVDEDNEIWVYQYKPSRLEISWEAGGFAKYIGDIDSYYIDNGYNVRLNKLRLTWEDEPVQFRKGDE